MYCLPFCLVSAVNDCCKNALGRGCTSSGNITKLEQSTFLYISMMLIWEPSSRREFSVMLWLFNIRRIATKSTTPFKAIKRDKHVMNYHNTFNLTGASKLAKYWDVLILFPGTSKLSWCKTYKPLFTPSLTLLKK